MGAKRLLRRPLTVKEILAWADGYREATGKWPKRDTGSIAESKFETWSSVDAALCQGLRGLAGGRSLSQLLAAERGVRNTMRLPRLTEEMILRWADEHHRRRGTWPTATSGAIAGTAKEKWQGIENALRGGLRGLPGGWSLSKLLAARRGARNLMELPSLCEEGILRWAEAHYRRAGSWPTLNSGPVTEAPGETWTAVENALRKGRRGLSGGSSLALLLAQKRGARHKHRLPDLAIEQILQWADAFHERAGKWPRRNSGPIPEAMGEKWAAVDYALRIGRRGLPAGSSLAKLVGTKRGVRTSALLPRLSRRQILAWADAHHRRTGKWPTKSSGEVYDAPGENWSAIVSALRNGWRGLRADASLARLLADYGRKRNIARLPPLSYRKILAWADAHHVRTGEWPHTGSGSVYEAPGERWDFINNALRRGNRGLQGGSSLLRLLIRKRRRAQAVRFGGSSALEIRSR
jgi:hypothetical protein